MVFGLNGLGRLVVTSILNQDLPVIMETVLLAAAFMIVVNIIVDICYALLDPRIRPS